MCWRKCYRDAGQRDELSLSHLALSCADQHIHSIHFMHLKLNFLMILPAQGVKIWNKLSRLFFSIPRNILFDIVLQQTDLRNISKKVQPRHLCWSVGFWMMVFSPSMMCCFSWWDSIPTDNRAALIIIMIKSHPYQGKTTLNKNDHKIIPETNLSWTGHRHKAVKSVSSFM